MEPSQRFHLSTKIPTLPVLCWLCGHVKLGPRPLLIGCNYNTLQLWSSHPMSSQSGRSWEVLQLGKWSQKVVCVGNLNLFLSGSIWYLVLFPSRRYLLVGFQLVVHTITHVEGPITFANVGFKSQGKRQSFSFLHVLNFEELGFKVGFIFIIKYKHMFSTSIQDSGFSFARFKTSVFLNGVILSQLILFQSKTFKINQPQTCRGSTYVGWMRGMFVYNNSFSFMVHQLPQKKGREVTGLDRTH